MQVSDRLELAGNAIEGYAMVVAMVVGVRREDGCLCVCEVDISDDGVRHS